MMLDNFLSMLTSAYTRKDIGQSPQTNIGKLYKGWADQMEFLLSQCALIASWENLDLAEGATLDRFGLNVDVPRGGADDVAYRIALYGAAKSGDGTIDGTVYALASLLNISPTSIKVTEFFPCKATLVIDEAAVTPEQAELIWLTQSVIQRKVYAGIQITIGLFREFNLTETHGLTEHYIINEDANFTPLWATTEAQFALDGQTFCPNTISDYPYSEGT